MKRCCWALGASLILAGCSTTRTAPVVDMTGVGTRTAKPHAQVASSKVKDWRPATHEVQKGDTLFSIALEYGLDYRDLSSWNNLADANHILIGQSLRLTAPENGVMTDDNKIKTVALKPPAIVTQSLSEPVSIVQPQAIKLPYSNAAVAQLSRVSPPENPVAAKPVAVSVPASAGTTAKPAVAADTSAPAAAGKETDDVALDWSWPTNGRVIAEFSEAKASKGIDISGDRGQPIYAAAAGKVVYSGSGLRGYGKLVIIKHNAIYLTAYAHNQQILVKEGQTINRGQKIAEMGDSDADQVELHFEVRQMGKPVDPLKYLPEVTK